MIASGPFHEWSYIIAGRMVNGAVEGLGIAILASLVLLVLGRRDSSTRFAIWFSALVAIAVLPLLSLPVSSASLASAGGARWAITVPGSWATDLVLAWAAIASIGLSRLVLGLWQLRKLRKHSRVIDPTVLDAKLQRTLQEFRLSRKVTLAVSEHVRVPTAIGFLKPLVVLPAWATRELSPDELNLTLIHELAHLERRDDWTNLAQQILRAILFFQPAVWWIERQLSLEREMACDDIVLSRTSNARAYAECLVSMAEKSLTRRGLALAQAVVSRMRQTSRRIAKILGTHSSGTRIRKPALGLVAILLVACVAGLSRAPELVAFQDASPVSAKLLTSRVLPVAVVDSKPLVSKSIPIRVKARISTSPAKALSARRQRDGVSPEPVDAGLRLGQSSDQMGAQANALEPRTNSQQTVLVVMRTWEYGPSGPELWTIRVWRVNVLRAVPVSIDSSIPAKSI